MFTIEEILEATKGRLLQGDPRATVKGISIDSRTVAKDGLFIAIKGERFDAHDFINDVLHRGVRAVITAKPIKVNDPKVSIIRVADTVKALGHLALWHRRRFSIPVIAITGSAGKTTSKEMISAVLKRKYTVLKNEGTKNNHIGVPLTLLQLKKRHNAVVLECGTNQPGDIPWLAEISRPTMVVFTNIGESHLERLKDKAGVLKEKWQLTAFMPQGATVILNADDPLLAQKADRGKKFNIVTYGINKKARFQARDIQVVKGRHLQLKLAGKTIELRSCGRNNAYNAAAAFACGNLLHVPAQEAAGALSAFRFPKGRQEMVRLGKGWLVDDSYNANPVSMAGAIEALSALSVKGKKILVAADMLELGPRAAEYHHNAGKIAAQAGIDVVITVGKLARHIGKGAGKGPRVFSYNDAAPAQEKLKEIYTDGDAVLIKGSRRMKMEEIVRSLIT